MFLQRGSLEIIMEMRVAKDCLCTDKRPRKISVILFDRMSTVVPDVQTSPFLSEGVRLVIYVRRLGCKYTSLPVFISFNF